MNSCYFEAEVTYGLEEIAYRELQTVLQKRLRLLQPVQTGSGAITFEYKGNLSVLLKLHTVLSVHLVQYFPVPRPKALLGHQHFQALLQQIHTARSLWPAGMVKTLYLSAAGSDSSVMNRLKDELSLATDLAIASHEGDLLIRVRRPPDRQHPDSAIRGKPVKRLPAPDPGWEVLVRLSPRPLSTRTWRVCNFEGALNATVASAICLLSQPRPQDIFLNLACGSGSILIERLAYGPARRMLGLDLDEQALACTKMNLAAYQTIQPPLFVELLCGDATAIPLPQRSVNILCADLPFGHLIGSHAENTELYPHIFREAGRVAQPGACFIIITHEIRLAENLLKVSSEWSVEKTLRVNQGGLNPQIFILRRK